MTTDDSIQTTCDNWAPLTTILAALFDRGFFLITISTSRSSALRKCWCAFPRRRVGQDPQIHFPNAYEGLVYLKRREPDFEITSVQLIGVVTLLSGSPLD